MRLHVAPEPGVSLPDAIAAGLVVLAAAEFAASRYFQRSDDPRTRLISSLLLWEAIAVLACAGVLHVRQDFDTSTIISIVAIWMAGAGMGLLRAGFFDAPRD